MKNLVILLGLAAIGAAGGVAAGLQFKPKDTGTSCVEPCETGADAEAPVDEKRDAGAPGEDAAPGNTVYISMKNQFVVPIIFDERVTSFVVISLSLEIESGAEETIYSHEPKLQDALLRVMFDHAYMGGFGGAFTESERMTSFRQSLRETASAVVGDILVDVLITEMVRQEV